MRFAPRRHEGQGLKRTIIFTIVIGIASGAVWYHLTSLDGLPGSIIGTILGADTAYASGYSERGFRAIQPRMSQENVQELLGPPLVETWSYYEPRNRFGCTALYFEHDALVSWFYNECESLGIGAGMAMAEVRRRFKAPDEVIWWYSRSPRSLNYRERVVHFSNGRVTKKIAHWYFD